VVQYPDQPAVVSGNQPLESALGPELGDPDVDPGDLLVGLVSRVLMKHPRMNARLDGNAIVTSSEVAS